MQRDFNKLVVSFDGTNVKDELGKDLSTKDAATNALLGNYRNEDTSFDEKMKRYKLAEKISTATGSVELDATEIKKLEEVVAKMYSTYVVGWVGTFLNSDPK